MQTWQLALVAATLVAGCAAEPAAGPQPSSATGLLTVAARGGDGDSWRDTEGREYRLGMVNAPEQGECFGSEATAERRRLLADGFRAEVYTDDRFGRGVSVVTTADGRNVNVLMARGGFVDDRYLAQFRTERPALAAELEPAFAAARRERAGLWGACQGLATAPPRAAPAGCHPDYLPCVRLKGDGSGEGVAHDLDCGDVDGRVLVRVRGVDPYRFDVDGNGVGCEGPPPS